MTHFVYLGSFITEDYEHGKEIRSILSKGQCVGAAQQGLKESQHPACNDTTY